MEEALPHSPNKKKVVLGCLLSKVNKSSEVRMMLHVKFKWDQMKSRAFTFKIKLLYLL